MLSRRIAAWGLLAVSGPASAADVVHTFVTGDLRITRGETTIDVSRVVEPKGIRTDPQQRHCKVVVRWSDAGPVHEVRPGCPGSLHSATEDAIRGWTMSVSPPPAAGAELFEVWFRFPVATGQATSVWLRPTYDATMRVVGNGVGVMAASPVELPAPPAPPELTVGDEGEVTCAVKVDVSGTGMTHRDTIEGCPDAWVEAVRPMLTQWKFKPPTLGGEPSEVGWTAGVRFVAEAGATPGELVTRAEVLTPTSFDSGAGGGPKLAPPVAAARTTDPTWDPYLRVDDDPNAEVGVYDFVWPDPVDGDVERRCPLLWQVDSRRRVIVWPEAACDPEVRDIAVAAAELWNLKPGAIEPGERFGRFHGTLVFPPAGAPPYLLVDAADLVDVDRRYKDRVHTFVDAKVITRVPPKIPKGAPPKTEVTCSVDLTVGADGRPRDLTAAGCDGDFADAALKAVKQWRWDAAAEDGVRRSSTAKVSLTFKT